jgi:hypothetical protein
MVRREQTMCGKGESCGGGLCRGRRQTIGGEVRKPSGERDKPCWKSKNVHTWQTTLAESNQAVENKPHN